MNVQYVKKSLMVQVIFGLTTKRNTIHHTYLVSSVARIFQLLKSYMCTSIFFFIWSLFDYYPLWFYIVLFSTIQFSNENLLAGYSIVMRTRRGGLLITWNLELHIIACTMFKYLIDDFIILTDFVITILFCQWKTSLWT